MAKIVHSEAAPSEAVHYTFAGAEFDLSGKKSYSTTDPDVIGAASAHPWLTVVLDNEQGVEPQYVDQIDPKDDPLSAVNSVGNDTDKALAFEATKRDDEAPLVAIDAGATQTEAVTTGEVAETLAADPTAKTTEKKD